MSSHIPPPARTSGVRPLLATCRAVGRAADPASVWALRCAVARLSTCCSRRSTMKSSDWMGTSGVGLPGPEGAEA
jgi:hypothetical protein